MALITCKECGNEVSDSAKTCPKCGARVKPRSKLWLHILVTPILIVALFTAYTMATITPDKSFQIEAEHQVSARLKDPDSAIFAGVFVIRESAKDGGIGQSVSACGIVDGKNSYGAHTGGARFVAHGLQGKNLLHFSIVELDDGNRRATVGSRDTSQPETIFEAVYWNKYCVDAAHPPLYTGEK